MAKAVGELEMREVERRLVAALKKECRDAIGYTLLTVLCTPFFVALIALAVMIMVTFIFRYSRYDMDARTFYTFTSLFLATMAGFVCWGSNPRERSHAFDITWLVGVAVLLLLIYMTYATSYLELKPRAFAIFYMVAGFIAMALFGRVYMKMPVAQDAGSEELHRSLPLVIFGIVAIAYGEIASSSWLWIPPDDDEIRVAAWILCKLAVDDDGRLDIGASDMRILNLLLRLKYIQIRDEMFELSYRGYEFVTAANQKEYAVE